MDGKNFPNVLYKYYPPERWRHVFIDWTVRFTPPEEFNDPFECKPHIEGIADESFVSKSFEANFLSELKAQFEAGPLKEQYTFQQLYAAIKQKFGEKKLKDGFIELANMIGSRCGKIVSSKLSDTFAILSLGEYPNIVLMWSHYGYGHKGFTIALNSKYFTRFVEGEDGVFKGNFICDPIQYTTKRPSGPLKNSSIRDHLFIKSDIWSYEHEWRSIAHLGDYEHSWIVSTVKGVMQLPKNAVSAVIFGACMPDGHIKARCCHIRSLPDCAHIKLQRARLHESHYELIIEEIEPDFYKR